MASELPEIDHTKEYSRDECLLLALAHYHAQMESYRQSPQTNNKPVVNQLSKLYNLPESTLRRHIQNPGQKTNAKVHEEQQLLTPAEEKILVERLLFLDDSNIPANRDLLYELAHNLLHRRIPGQTIGNKWIYRFLARHPECQYVMVQSIATNRANAVTWDIMDDFFAKLKQATTKYSIAPRNTYNMDEKGFILDVGEATKRICRSVRKNPQFKEHRNRESCTVVECISADGFVVVSLIIFKGQNHLAGWFKDKKTEEYWYGYAPKGFNNSQLCIEYLERIFQPETVARAHDEWRLLIFDGFESHLNLELIEYCLNHKILPFCLPAHTSHVLQPLDVAVFSALKTYYRQEVNKLRIPVDKNCFSHLLATARKKAFSLSNIYAGFRATGIWPYDPIVILQHLSLPEPVLNHFYSLKSLPIPAKLQPPHVLLSYNPTTPTTPRSIQDVYLEALSTLDSNSPCTAKQGTLFEKLKMGAEKNVARAAMHEAGENHLREVIKERDRKGNTDTRHLNSNSACILERGTVLEQMKQKRDEKEAGEEEKRQLRETEKIRKLEEKERIMEEKRVKAVERCQEKLRKAAEKAQLVEERKRKKEEKEKLHK